MNSCGATTEQNQPLSGINATTIRGHNPSSDKVRIPKGVHLFYLPPKSPELQPAERLWLLTNEAIANRSFAPTLSAG